MNGTSSLQPQGEDPHAIWMKIRDERKVYQLQKRIERLRKEAEYDREEEESESEIENICTRRGTQQELIVKLVTDHTTTHITKLFGLPSPDLQSNDEDEEKEEEEKEEKQKEKEEETYPQTNIDDNDIPLSWTQSIPEVATSQHENEDSRATSSTMTATREDFLEVAVSPMVEMSFLGQKHTL